MFKRCAAVLVIMAALAVLFPGTALAYEENQYAIYVNNQLVYADVEPFVYENRMMVPIRFISEALGASVEWNQRRQEAFIYQGEDVLAIMPDTPIYKNGEEVYSDVYPMAAVDRIFVPLRAVAEALNCDVDWDPGSGEIYVNSY